MTTLFLMAYEKSSQLELPRYQCYSSMNSDLSRKIMNYNVG